jgi:hypothetical protein
VGPRLGIEILVLEFGNEGWAWLLAAVLLDLCIQILHGLAWVCGICMAVEYCWILFLG